MTAAPGTGPNFLIVGAAKSGTTSLCHYLRQHPDVFVARQKESHYFLFQDREPAFSGPGDAAEFNTLIIPDLERYEACFTGAGRATARGEASVYYLYEPESLERALAYDPAMKFVAVLRDPVERAFSAWSHMMRDGREPEQSFLAALDDEHRRAALGWSYGFRYDSVGRYAAQVEAAQQVVPREQLHVLLYEDLVQHPAPTLAALFAFLGVAPLDVDSSLVMNASGKPRLAALNAVLTQRNPLKEGLKKILPYRLTSSLAQRVRNWNLEAVSMPVDARRALQARYAPDVQRLSGQLDRDLSEWSAAHPH